jgi:hypothetical protein
MAITTTTISKAAGWARTDMLYQLESAFTWLGWQGDTISGIVTGISAYSGGGTVGAGGTYYYEVFPTTTSGIGTGASFNIYRSSTIQTIYVNRPGVGYTAGEYLTLSAADIGGSANGAVAIGLTVQVAGGASPVGYGTTTAFFDKDLTAGSTNPWGVVKHQIQPNKKFGDTYRGFQATSATTFNLSQGSSFHPWDTDNSNNRGNSYGNRFAGNASFEFESYVDSTSGGIRYTTSSVPNQLTSISFTAASSNSYQLDLNIYRSALDPKFAVFAYKQPTLSSSNISNNNFDVFFFHNFTTSLWDLDYLFLGGFTKIVPVSSPTSQPRITFYTYFGSGNQKRSAEWGYSGGGQNYIKYSDYESTIYSQDSSNELTFYTRTASNSVGGYGNYETLNSNTFYNAVIKGIPLSTKIAPVPYYLPDEFVFIDFQINTPSVNVQQGDTITISGSEVYTVITASYNQTTTTRGIAFCARTV